MITSTSNARIKRLVNLKKKRKLRDEESVFLVEGIRMFREVPLDKLKEVYVSESFYKKEKDTGLTILIHVLGKLLFGKPVESDGPVDALTGQPLSFDEPITIETGTKRR